MNADSENATDPRIRSVDLAAARRSARRVIRIIFSIQAAIVLALLAAGAASWLPVETAALPRTILMHLALPAIMLGIPSLVIAPMLVLFCCATTLESRTRTLTSIAITVLLASAMIGVCLIPWNG
jgi:hypothetical protein